MYKNVCTCLLLRRYLHRFSPVADVDVIQAAHIVTGLVSICTVPPHLAPGRRCYIKTPENCEKYKCTVWKILHVYLCVCVCVPVVLATMLRSVWTDSISCVCCLCRAVLLVLATLSRLSKDSMAAIWVLMTDWARKKFHCCLSIFCFLVLHLHRLENVLFCSLLWLFTFNDLTVLQILTFLVMFDFPSPRQPRLQQWNHHLRA